jgi:hypothetical protein
MQVFFIFFFHRQIVLQRGIRAFGHTTSALSRGLEPCLLEVHWISWETIQNHMKNGFHFLKSRSELINTIRKRTSLGTWRVPVNWMNFMFQVKEGESLTSSFLFNRKHGRTVDNISGTLWRAVSRAKNIGGFRCEQTGLAGNFSSNLQ